MTTATEQAFLQDFGKLLVQLDADPRQPTASRAAQAFADHLRGVRLRAGLTREALAARAGLTVATLLALELAALPADSLAWPQLTALARVLGEDIEFFALLLERELPEPAPASARQRLRRAWDTLVAYLGSPAQAWTALALSVTAFGGAVLAAVLGLMPVGAAPGHPPAWVGVVHWIRGFMPSTGPPQWGSTHAGLYVPLTLIGVLILVLVWLLLANHDLPARWAHRVHRRPGLLLNGTTLALLLLLFVSGFRQQPADSAHFTPTNQPIARTSVDILGPPHHGAEVTSIGVSPLLRSLSGIFDSSERSPSLGDPASFGRIAPAAPSGQQRNATRPVLVNTTTMEQTFLRRPNQPDLRVNQVLLVCQALGVGLLYTVVWRVVSRVGRWRRVTTARPSLRRGAR